MTSALRPTGSTRTWRRIVAYVLEHKGRRCQMTRHGRTCGAHATTVQHVVQRRHGGTDDLNNLIPACTGCNYGERPPAGAAPLGPPPVLTGRAAAVVDALDALGVACAAGRRQAVAALDRWNVPIRPTGAQVDAACAYRRTRGPLTRL